MIELQCSHSLPQGILPGFLEVFFVNLIKKSSEDISPLNPNLNSRDQVTTRGVKN